MPDCFVRVAYYAGANLSNSVYRVYHPTMWIQATNTAALAIKLQRLAKPVHCNVTQASHLVRDTTAQKL